MKRLAATVISLLIFATGMVCSPKAFADDGTTSYAGDLWFRSTLTGDWGGVRDDLAKKGVTVDFSLKEFQRPYLKAKKFHA